MSERNEKATEKVWAKVPPRVRIAIETVAERNDHTVSHVTKRILELDPKTMREYRAVLKVE